MTEEQEFTRLIDYLEQIPAISSVIGTGCFENGGWWIKFAIDIEHPLAWHTVQELGHVLNYISLESRLPTVFKPVPPPPYMNGGPKDYLSWVIENYNNNFLPETCMKWLEARLPQPVDDVSQWGT